MKIVQALALGVATILAAPTVTRGAADCSAAAVVGTFVGGMPVYAVSNEKAAFFKGRMTIDADGAPNAYCPAPLRGLDALGNAGRPGNWFGVVVDSNKNPIVQGADDPHPGCYVSATTLEDRSKKVSDPARYVDAAAIPYIVLPGGDTAKAIKAAQGIKLGDYAVAFNSRTGKHSAAIFADGGPKDSAGEGSIKLAELLGVPNTSPRDGGVSDRSILYVVFPGSGDGKPHTSDEIASTGETLLRDWGGLDRLIACFSVAR